MSAGAIGGGAGVHVGSVHGGPGLNLGRGQHDWEGGTCGVGRLYSIVSGHAVSVLGRFCSMGTQFRRAVIGMVAAEDIGALLVACTVLLCVEVYTHLAAAGEGTGMGETVGRVD